MESVLERILERVRSELQIDVSRYEQVKYHLNGDEKAPGSVSKKVGLFE